ncbi:MAG: M48 family metalloprotease, partial [Treponema sp.]|nr:M48 family metalloprotease [Treponema sp.]
MKKICIFFALAPIAFFACATNPLTGGRTMAIIPNSQLFAMAAEQYAQLLSESAVVYGTPEALAIERVGRNIADAAQRWLDAQGRADWLDGFDWSFALIQDDSVNAWAMPGGKIAFYTGILPITRDEAGIAVVMGHEIAHAVLHHGQQRMSAAVLQEMGAAGIAAAMSGGSFSPETQAATMTAFGVGSALFGTLPF